MKIQILAVAGLAAAGVAGMAAADGPFLDVTVQNMGEVVSGHTTYQLRLNAVGNGGLIAIGDFQSGNGKNVLSYNGALLWNATTGPAAGNDFENYNSAPGDSWVALGGYDAGSNPPSWSPGFAAYAAAQPVGQRFIVKGTSWGGMDFAGESYFVTPAFIADDGTGILIAQFTVLGIFGDGELPFTYEGQAGMQGGNFYFNVVPAPGALALIGLAGLAGRRRRA